MLKKILKKFSRKPRPLKKISRKKGAPNKGSKKKSKESIKKPQQIGRVTHYFGGIKVAIVKFKKSVRTGSELRFRGATTDFSLVVKSMQYDHKSIVIAPKGKEVGIKVNKMVREGDGVYAESR